MIWRSEATERTQRSGHGDPSFGHCGVPQGRKGCGCHSKLDGEGKLTKMSLLWTGKTQMVVLQAMKKIGATCTCSNYVDLPSYPGLLACPQ